MNRLNYLDRAFHCTISFLLNIPNIYHHSSNNVEFVSVFRLHMFSNNCPNLNSNNWFEIENKSNSFVEPVQALRYAEFVEQNISGHGCSSRSDPMHNRPLCFGSGFVQVRVRERNDLPHVFGHKLQSLHGDHPPSTKVFPKKILSFRFAFQQIWFFTLALFDFNIWSMTQLPIKLWRWLCTCSRSTLTFFTCCLLTRKPRRPWRPTTVNWINTTWSLNKLDEFI